MSEVCYGAVLIKLFGILSPSDNVRYTLLNSDLLHTVVFDYFANCAKQPKDLLLICDDDADGVAKLKIVDTHT